MYGIKVILTNTKSVLVFSPTLVSLLTGEMCIHILLKSMNDPEIMLGLYEGFFENETIQVSVKSDDNPYSRLFTYPNNTRDRIKATNKQEIESGDYWFELYPENESKDQIEFKGQTVDDMEVYYQSIKDKLIGKFYDPDSFLNTHVNYNLCLHVGRLNLLLLIHSSLCCDRHTNLYLKWFKDDKQVQKAYDDNKYRWYDENSQIKPEATWNVEWANETQTAIDNDEFWFRKLPIDVLDPIVSLDVSLSPTKRYAQVKDRLDENHLLIV